MPITFVYPLFLALVVLVVPVLWLASRRRKALGHTQVGSHTNVRSVPLVGRIPTVMLVGFWVAMVLAIARPQLPEVGEKETIRTRDFVIATDISGSMSSTIQDPSQLTFTGTATDKDGKPVEIKRIMVAEKAIQVFVDQRQGDRVALFLFDDETYYSWPLSSDLKVIQLKNKGISRYNGGGTNFDTEKGPIQAAINHFKELGQAETKILIMVTDGEASIPQERFDALLRQLQAGKIKIYVLGVGEGWVNGSTQTKDLQNLSEASGGQAIIVGNADQMRAGFELINALEKSDVKVEKTVSYRDIYQYFLMVALALGMLYLISSAVVREDA